MKNFHNENLLEALRTPAGGYDRRTIEMLGKQFPWVNWPPKSGWKKRIEESERDIVIPEDWNEQLESEQHFLAKVDAILDSVNRIEKRVMQEAKCACGEDSTGWTEVKCCNICGLPHQDETLEWTFPADLYPKGKGLDETTCSPSSSDSPEVSELLGKILDECGVLDQRNAPEPWVNLARKLERERSALLEIRETMLKIKKAVDVLVRKDFGATVWDETCEQAARELRSLFPNDQGHGRLPVAETQPLPKTALFADLLRNYDPEAPENAEREKMRASKMRALSREEIEELQRKNAHLMGNAYSPTKADVEASVPRAHSDTPKPL